jgi:hypothetical protein
LAVVCYFLPRFGGDSAAEKRGTYRSGRALQETRGGVLQVRAIQFATRMQHDSHASGSGAALGKWLLFCGGCGIGPETGAERQSSEASAKAKELLDPVNNELKAAAEAADQHQRLEYGEARPASVEMAMRALLCWWWEWAGRNKTFATGVGMC